MIANVFVREWLMPLFEGCLEKVTCLAGSNDFNVFM